MVLQALISAYSHKRVNSGGGPLVHLHWVGFADVQWQEVVDQLVPSLPANLGLPMFKCTGYICLF